MSNDPHFLLEYCYKRKPRCIVKDHNLDSEDSTLKVKYIKNYNCKDKEYKKIIINPLNYKKNFILPRIKYKVNDLRKEQFNSYSNENMDFFRLDYLCECNRDNYHNKNMDKLIPINRKENFEKYSEMGNNIKYLDYIKGNYILSQNKIINNNILNSKSNNNINFRNNNNFRKSKSQFYDSNYTGNNTVDHNKNYSNLYLMNINDYSIKENDNFNCDKINKFSTISSQKIPFYKAYHDNIINYNGFNKKESSFSNYNKNCGNRYIYRNDNTQSSRYYSNVSNFHNYFNKKDSKPRDSFKKIFQSC